MALPQFVFELNEDTVRLRRWREAIMTKASGNGTP
jgi:hypothetical protein